ncbi:MAG: AAA family ATPase [Phycisphaerales bacterium]|nr:MAG: AAA family ATPase [Phycisphaerales bacterium]
MRSVAVLNQKGGVGKTTTVANLGAALGRLGNRVLVVDLDPQSHLTLHLGLDTSSDGPSVHKVLLDGMSAADAIVDAGENLSAISSNIDLAAAELELVSVVGREVVLRDALEKINTHFDICLIDCPPSLGILTLNALAAAREVIIPLLPHFLALQGLGKLLETIALVSRRLNPDLTVRGVLLCMYEGGTRLCGEVVSDLESFLDAARGANLPWSRAELFKTVIRRNVRLAESPSYGQTIFCYEPKCHGAEDYEALAREVLAVDDGNQADGQPAAGSQTAPTPVTVGEQPAAQAASPQQPEARPPRPEAAAPSQDGADALVSTRQTL